MRSMQRLWAIFLVLTLTAPHLSAGEKQWVEVRSKNFSLITDGGEKQGRAVLLRFEQMRVAFAAIFQRAKVNIPVPVQIIAFDGRKQMRDYGPIWKGKPVDLAGFFQGGEDRNFIALDLSSEAGFPVVFHEYAHMLLNANLPPSPVWFDEGYAEYCSSLTVSKKEIEFGRIPENLPQVLQDNRWMKTLDLFSVQHDSKEYNEQDRRSIFYAQSWLTVHYIMEKQLGKRLDVYLNLARNGTPPAEAISKAFGMEPAQFDKVLMDYFRVGAMKYLRLAAPPDLEGGPYEVRPLTPVQAQAILADLHYHSKDYRERGIEEFKKILQQDPDNVTANRGLGLALLFKNDLQGAAGYIERAAAKDDSDARLHYYHAMLMQRSGEFDAERQEQMRAELEKAVAIDPSYADAYSLLAFSDNLRGDRAAALQHARKAVELNPRGEHLRLNLAMALMQARDWEGARATLTALKSSSNPMFAAQAQQNLEQLNRMEQYARDRQASIQAEVERVELPSVTAEATPLPVDKRPIKFLKGQLTSVDCSATPAAVMTVTAAGKAVQLRVPDVGHVVVIGAAKFSCAWTNQRVAVNYRAATDSGGEVISVELQ